MEYKFTGQYSNESDFGLYYFNARWYDAGLKHFSSPDTIIPDNYNALDWDRFAYSRSNPLKFNDPSGHFASIAVGAGLGAVAGLLIYCYSQSSNFNWNDAAIAVGIGAAGGALIGTGVGLTEGSIIIVGLGSTGTTLAAGSAGGAGMGVVASQIAYSALTNDYKSSELVVQACYSGVTGAVTGYTSAAALPAVGIMSTGAAALTNIGVNTVMGAGQYSTTQLVNGQSPTASGLVFSGAWSGATGAFGEIVAPVGKPSKYWIENFVKDAVRNIGLNLEYNYITNRIPVKAQ